MSVLPRAPHLGPERRRPLILDAALTIAVRDGIGAVTVGSLAVEMGVTRSVVYAAYRDRVDVLTALMDREQATLIADVLMALHGAGGAASPEQAFVSGFIELLQAADRRAPSWRLLLLGEPDAAMSGRLASARVAVTAEATAWMRPAIEQWWHTEDLDRKMPVLVDLFMAACESAIGTLLDPAQEWTAEDLGALVGRSVCAMFERA